jgi:hypothetical protein
MHKELREYIDSLFAEAPPTKKMVEVKEEILQNLTDKYDDLIAEGKSEEAAYNISVASVGDISELIEELKGKGPSAQTDEIYAAEKRRGALLTSVSVVLYILSIVPILLFQDVMGVILMFVMIAVATGLIIYKGMTKRQTVKVDETIAAEVREWREQSSAKNQSFRAVSSAIWSLAVVVYILVSFLTHAWHISWIIVLIAWAVSNIFKAFFDLRK